MYYDALLKLCGFEPEKIEKERPRIDKTFQKLGLTAEDMKNAEERVTQYFDLELTGIRKMLGLWIECLVDLVLAREERKKLVYCSFPAFTPLTNAMAMVSQDIYVSAPEIILVHTMGLIFGKQTSLLEAAEGSLLQRGLANCSLLQTMLGGIIKGYIPVPDLIVPSGILCDQAPELHGLIGEMYDVPVAHLDSVVDEMGENWPLPSERRVKYLVQTTKDVLTKFQEVTGYEVTEDIFMDANLRYFDLIKAGNELIELVKYADPTPISYVNLGTTFRLTRFSSTTTIFGNPGEIIDLLYKELKQRIDRGEGILPKGSPNVSIIMSPTEPSIVKMIEASGLVVRADAMANTEAERSPSKYEDFWDISAESFLKKGMCYCGYGFAIQLKQICKEWNLDGAILSFQLSCRGFATGPHKAKDLITKELGIPALILECEASDIREYSAESMRTRVETFAEVVKAHKAAKEEKN